MSNIKLKHGNHHNSSRTCPLPVSRIAKIGLLLSAAFVLQVSSAHSATIVVEPVGVIGHPGDLDANDYVQYDAAKDDFVAVKVDGTTPPVANAANKSTNTIRPTGGVFTPKCDTGADGLAQGVIIAGRPQLSCTTNGTPGKKPDPKTDCNQNPSAGNPILINTGLKVQTEVDYAGPDGLSFVRTYRSSSARFESVITSISDAYPALYVAPYLNTGGIGASQDPQLGSFRIRSYDANNLANEPARVPGLSSLPIIGRLFTNKNDTHDKSEIVLLITPRIVRNVVPPEASLGEFSIGTESGNAPSVRATSFGYVPPAADIPKRGPLPVIPESITPEQLQPKSVDTTQKSSTNNSEQKQLSPQPLPDSPTLPAPPILPSDSEPPSEQ